MSFVMKNYTIVIRRHYEFTFNADSKEDALNQLNATISDEGMDDNRVIFEDYDLTEGQEEG